MGKEQTSVESKDLKETKAETPLSKAPKIPEMDTKTSNNMVITVKGKKDRVYRFLIPFYSPLDECYHAAINVANEIARLFNETIEKAKKDASAKDTSVKEASLKGKKEADEKDTSIEKT